MVYSMTYMSKHKWQKITLYGMTQKLTIRNLINSHSHTIVGLLQRGLEIWHTLPKICNIVKRWTKSIITLFQSILGATFNKSIYFAPCFHEIEYRCYSSECIIRLCSSSIQGFSVHFAVCFFTAWPLNLCWPLCSCFLKCLRHSWQFCILTEAFLLFFCT